MRQIATVGQALRRGGAASRQVVPGPGRLYIYQMLSPHPGVPSRQRPWFLFLLMFSFAGVAGTEIFAESIQPAAEDQPVEAGTPPARINPADAMVPEADAGAPEGDLPAGAVATDESTIEKPYWRTNLFGRFFRDQRFLLTTWWPAELRRPWFSGPVLAGVALATTSNGDTPEGADMELGDYVKSEASGHARSVAGDLSFLGNTGPGALLIGAGYLIGRWSHHDRLAEASSLSAEALLSSGLYTTIFKHLTARTRPANGGRGNFFEFSPQDGQVASSFPSGHAAGAFTVAAVFSGVYSDHHWVPWVAYGTAGLVGWARVAQHRHFPSDILVGAMIGSSIGRMAVTRNRETAGPAASLEPFFDPTGPSAGIVWTRHW